MTLKELNETKTPIIPFDKKLEKLSSKVLAVKKLEEAKKIIAQVGIPKRVE